MKHYGMVFCVFVALFLVSSYAWGMGERPSGSSWCAKTGLYLKMSGTLLYIPPDLTQRSAVRNNRAIPRKPFCYENGSEPLEVDSLSLFPNKYFSELSVEGKRDEIGRFLGLWLLVSAYNKNTEDEFETLRRQNDLVLETLPKEHGFYLYKKDNSRSVFISDPVVLATPRGNPVVFTCDENNSKYCIVLLSIGKTYFGLEQINRFHIPIEDWPKFYKQFEGLVDRLIIENETEILPLQVQGENQ